MAASRRAPRRARRRELDRFSGARPADPRVPASPGLSSLPAPGTAAAWKRSSGVCSPWSALGRAAKSVNAPSAARGGAGEPLPTPRAPNSPHSVSAVRGRPARATPSDSGGGRPAAARRSPSAHDPPGLERPVRAATALVAASVRVSSGAGDPTRARADDVLAGTRPGAGSDPLLDGVAPGRAHITPGTASSSAPRLAFRRAGRTCLDSGGAASCNSSAGTSAEVARPPLALLDLASALARLGGVGGSPRGSKAPLGSSTPPWARAPTPGGSRPRAAPAAPRTRR